ncbi:hypothetical protein ALIPUT_01089 [Alistipes putredinis DSM 17216]|uniref:Uncharacterized protein n=1 Tax=Alistipes putredinis DSM 17216 TaxID=445970 RepID=B0MV78_9BACT|nr:hypothetical protein ALIPUT_01089 [Alistipes putredinis DSM 17216]
MKAGCKIDFAGFCRNGFPVLCKDTKITLKSGVYFCFLFGFFVIVGKVWGAAGRNPGI